MITTTVQAFDRFGLMEEQVDRLCVDALNAAAAEGASVAAGIGAARGLTDIQVIAAHGDIEGFTAGIAGRWYYRFQSYGTLSKAIRPKRPGRIRDHSKGGIEPNRMWQHARTAMRRRLLEHLRA